MGSLDLQCLKTEFRTLVQHAYKRDLCAFVLWLDLKVSEFKVNGYMFLNEERICGTRWLEFAECQQQVRRGQGQGLPRRPLGQRLNRQQMPHQMGAGTVDYMDDELEEIDMEGVAEAEYDGEYMEGYEGEVMEGDEEDCILLSSDEEAEKGDINALQAQGESEVNAPLSRPLKGKAKAADPNKNVTQAKAGGPLRGKSPVKSGVPGKALKSKPVNKSASPKQGQAKQVKSSTSQEELKPKVIANNGTRLKGQSKELNIPQSTNGSQEEYSIPEEEAAVECTVCHIVFDNQQVLQNHLQEHKVMVKSDDQTARMMCPLCNKMFKHSSSFSRHMKMHQGFYSHICDTCGRKFTRKDLFMNHKCVLRNANVDVEYETEEEYVEDPTTGQTALSALQQAMQFGGSSMELQGALLGSNVTQDQPTKRRGQGRPMRPVMGPAMGPAMGKRLVGGTIYMCTTCNRTFTHQSSYNRHMNQHKGLYAHECGICLRRFSRKDSFRAHRCRGMINQEEMATMNSPVDRKVAAELGCTPIPPTPPKTEPYMGGPTPKKLKMDPLADGDDFDQTMAAIDEAIANTQQVKAETGNLPSGEQKRITKKGESGLVQT